MAPFSLGHVGQGADVVDEGAGSLRRRREPYQEDEDGRDDYGTGNQERNLVLLRPNPTQGKVEDGEDDEGREVASGHGPVGERRVDVGEGRPDRREENPHALTAPVHLGREPDASEEDALDDDELEPIGAPGAFLDDGKSNMPFGSWRAAENAEDAHDHVSDDDRQHSLPDVEPQGNQR